MKKIIIVFVCSFLLINKIATAQKKRTGKNSTQTKAVIDSVKWASDHYIVNRDSAFANPQIGLKKLMGGNRRFVEGISIRPRQDSLALHSTEGGQTPYAVIVGCSDSRVPNEIIFDQGIGDLFIVRTAGQVMASASYASIEFALLELKSKLIVVLGHEKCGAVKAVVNNVEIPASHIPTLINAIKPAAEKSKYMAGDRLSNAVRENVLEQVYQLRDLEPVLSKKYKSGEILIVGAVYDLHTGKVEFLDETLRGLPNFKSN